MTHLAGPAIMVAGRFCRQRCAWCGEILLNYDLQNTYSTSSEPPMPWREGAWVLVYGAASIDTGSIDRPDDSCVTLEISR